jgi:hypothetical protein
VVEDGQLAARRATHGVALALGAVVIDVRRWLRAELGVQLGERRLWHGG